MNKLYNVKRLEEGKTIEVTVPGSKSITNRALLLAALSNKQCVLEGVLFSDDTEAFLDSLQRLGFEIALNREKEQVIINGAGGKIPNSQAIINVRSAGTAARFLTVMLAFGGGNYEMQASSQMCKRPMKPLLDTLRKTGVIIECLHEEEHFPFVLKSDLVNAVRVTVGTDISSQFASALLMSGVLLDKGLEIQMEGSRAEGAYIKMTLAMMEQFGISVEKRGNVYKVPGRIAFGLEHYCVEPDVSGASYFYAMAPLLKADVLVHNVHSNSIQGDIQFVQVLHDLGCAMSESKEGIRLSGVNLKEYNGVDISMRNFSDQTMTMCALAPFAIEPTLIRNIGHIKYQETNRLQAVLTELKRMGIQCEEVPEADGLRIYPGEIRQATVETYEDHRMAMAFTLIGLKTGKIEIVNPECCRKTFANYFDLIEELYD